MTAGLLILTLTFLGFCQMGQFLLETETSGNPIFTKAGDGSLPFSKSVRVGNLLFLSGQIGRKKDRTLADGFQGQFELIMNEIYKTFLKTNFPARSTYQVAALPLGAVVEVEV